MPLFLSTYTNKVDKKGRVSVPAQFRNELEKAGYNSFIAFPHPDLRCIEAWDKERMDRYAEGMDEFSPMSAEYASVSTLMTASREVVFGPEGRIVVPEYLLDYLDPEGTVIFAGRGQTFQIWRPDRFADYELEVKNRAAQLTNVVRLAPRRPRSDND